MDDDLQVRLRDCALANGHIGKGRLAALLGEAADEIGRLRRLLGAGAVPSVAEAGRRGGKARAKSLTAAQRSEAARKAVKVRWGKREDALP